jgi:hypothetical protein
VDGFYFGYGMELETSRRISRDVFSDAMSGSDSAFGCRVDAAAAAGALLFGCAFLPI